MRITNKIMQNNSLYNINNNKVSEDQLNTMMATGKKITRPSDDPVIAIRALRLRSNVTQLSQYYEKNAKDAQSWLEVTADALSTVTSVLTDCVKQATKGANKDLTLDDLATIVSQMDALSDEYYATGNVDYAGRYIFTGYRTDTALTFDKASTADYRDINDEFRAGAVSTSSRIIGKHLLDSSTILNADSSATLESQIVETTVGRIRLSYDNLNYRYGEGSEVELKFRQDMKQPATSSVSTTKPTIDLTFKDEDGVTRYVALPINSPATDFQVTSEGITYKALKNGDGTYNITGIDAVNGKTYEFYLTSEGLFDDNKRTKSPSVIQSANTEIVNRQVSTVTYTTEDGQIPPLEVPLLPAIGQSYSMSLSREGYFATVNSDGTFTVKNNIATDNGDGTYSNQVVQLTGNGSVHSSYIETTLVMDEEHILYTTSTEQQIDDAYADLYNNPTGMRAYLNAATGEVLLNENLRNKLSTLPDIINANSIDVVYDKKEWIKGDIRPENLFSTNYIDENGKEILYNKGTANHDIAYDVGFAQSVVVNTTADAVFTTNVKRDVDDLSKMLGELQQLATIIKTLKDKKEAAVGEDQKLKVGQELASAQKAYDYLREELQQEFEHKITSMQKSLDVANIAVTDNGTRAKRLDLINSRLMDQTTTFKTLQSDNEDIDLAEAATQLTTAQITYEASLMATGKISQTSLMNYS